MFPSPLTFGRLSRAIALRCEQSFHPLHAWTPSDYGNALAGETGEACNWVKKLKRLDDGPAQPYNAGVERADVVAKIGKELADVVCYADLLAQSLGLDLGTEVRAKFNEVSGRVGSAIILPEQIP